MDEIRLQKALLNEGQLHDAPGVVATLLADFEIDDDYLKAPTKKQKSMVEEISEDKSILHPKKKMLDPQKFIKEILQKDIIENLDKTVTYQNSLEFQLKHFEDFFIGSFQMEHGNNTSSSQKDGERGQHQNRSSQLSDFSISRNNFYGTDTISENLKNINLDSIEIQKKEKDRSGSSDTKNGQETSPKFDSIKALSDIGATNVSQIEPENNLDDRRLAESPKSGLDTNFDTDELQHLSNNSFENQEQMLRGPGIKCLRNKRTKKKQPKKGHQRPSQHEEDKIPSGDDLVQLWDRSMSLLNS